MSNFEFTESESWGGLLVVRKVSEIESRLRLVVTGIWNPMYRIEPALDH